MQGRTKAEALLRFILWVCPSYLPGAERVLIRTPQPRTLWLWLDAPVGEGASGGNENLGRRLGHQGDQRPYGMSPASALRATITLRDNFQVVGTSGCPPCSSRHREVGMAW
jgi:hypothetical protein